MVVYYAPKDEYHGDVWIFERKIWSNLNLTVSEIPSYRLRRINSSLTRNRHVCSTVVGGAKKDLLFAAAGGPAGSKEFSLLQKRERERERRSVRFPRNN